MSSEGSEGTGLVRHLLCAVPQLLDPNFHRSVILMLDHGEEGALGLVLNQPMKAPLGRIAGSLSLEWAGDPDNRVRSGGPVEQARGWFLHDDPSWDLRADELASGLWLTTSLDAVVGEGNARFGGDGSRFVFLVGYAGWGGGQIEEEIAAGSWVVIPILDGSERDSGSGGGGGVGVDFLFDTDPDRMWHDALQSIGVDPQRLVGMQGSHALH